MNRLTNHEIRLFFAKARRVRHPSFDILLLPAKHPQGRLVVITPRKIGNAPERNKVRRRLKAIFHEENISSQGIDLVVIIKEPGIACSFDTLKDLLRNALQ